MHRVQKARRIVIELATIYSRTGREWECSQLHSVRIKLENNIELSREDKAIFGKALNGEASLLLNQVLVKSGGVPLLMLDKVDEYREIYLNYCR